MTIMKFINIKYLTLLLITTLANIIVSYQENIKYNDSQYKDIIVIRSVEYIQEKLIEKLFEISSNASIQVVENSFDKSVTELKMVDLLHRNISFDFNLKYFVDYTYVQSYIECAQTIYHFGDNMQQYKTSALIDSNIIHAISVSSYVKTYIYIDISYDDSYDRINDFQKEDVISRYQDLLRNNKKLHYYQLLHFENVYGPGIDITKSKSQIISFLIKQSLSMLSYDMKIINGNRINKFIYIDDLIQTIVNNQNNSYPSITAKDKLYLTVSTIKLAQMISVVSHIIFSYPSVPCFNDNTDHMKAAIDDNNYWTNELLIHMIKTYADISYRFGTLQLNQSNNDEKIGEYGYATPRVISWISTYTDFNDILNSVRFIKFSNHINKSSYIISNNTSIVKCKNNEIIKNKKKTLIFHHVPDLSGELPYYYIYMPYFNDTYDICHCSSYSISKCNCFPNIVPDVHFMGESILSHPYKVNVQDFLNMKVKCRVAFLNKEYKELPLKLQYIKKIKPDIAFTHQHDLKYFIDSTNVPFARIPFATTVTDFNHYANINSKVIPYKIDVSTSGNNFRIPWRLWYNNTGIESLKIKGINANVAEWAENTEQYVKNIITSKMWVSTLSEADILTVRVFDVMATNRTLLFVNLPSDYRILRGVLTTKHVILFESNDDFIQKVIYYSTHEEERLTIVKAAYELTINNHDWKHRAELMKSIIKDC